MAWLSRICDGDFVMLTVIIVELFSSCISFFHSQLSAILSMPRPLLLIQHSKKIFFVHVSKPGAHLRKLLKGLKVTH